MPFVKDPVRAKDRAEVYRRDGGCIAPLVDRSAGPCRDGLGRVIDRTSRRGRTIDHVPRYPGSTRISSPRWMVWLCRGHHAFPSYWETAHRQDERDYLAEKYGDLSMDLEDLVTAVGEAGGGMSSDEPAMNWMLMIEDRDGSKIKVDGISIDPSVGGEIRLRLKAGFKIEMA